DFVIGAGRYYVDGLLVENESPVYYSAQAELPNPTKLAAGKTYVAYLDVWERHITYLEDDGIREVALGGPDSTTRVKTMWQVKVIESGGGRAETGDTTPPVEREKLRAQLADVETKLSQATDALKAETERTRATSLRRTISTLERQAAGLRSRLEASETP